MKRICIGLLCIMVTASQTMFALGEMAVVEEVGERRPSHRNEEEEPSQHQHEPIIGENAHKTITTKSPYHEGQIKFHRTPHLETPVLPTRTVSEPIPGQTTETIHTAPTPSPAPSGTPTQSPIQPNSPLTPHLGEPRVPTNRELIEARTQANEQRDQALQKFLATPENSPDIKARQRALDQANANLRKAQEAVAKMPKQSVSQPKTSQAAIPVAPPHGEPGGLPAGETPHTAALNAHEKLTAAQKEHAAAKTKLQNLLDKNAPHAQVNAAEQQVSKAHTDIANAHKAINNALEHLNKPVHKAAEEMRKATPGTPERVAAKNKRIVAVNAKNRTINALKQKGWTPPPKGH